MNMARKVRIATAIREAEGLSETVRMGDNLGLGPFRDMDCSAAFPGETACCVTYVEDAASRRSARNIFFVEDGRYISVPSATHSKRHGEFPVKKVSIR